MILLLTPTRGELALLEKHSRLAEEQNLQLCGFGPVISAATTARLIQQRQPAHVVLAGIAGSYSSARPPGTAWVFTTVGCYGIGVGSGAEFQTATESGWPQLQSTDVRAAVDDSIPLFVPDSEQVRVAVAGELLTCTSAAANDDDKTVRLKKFPNAEAEEMEGFSVAAACQMAGIPVTIIRGVSNHAGDREKSGWLVEPAMKAAAELVDNVVRAVESGLLKK